MYGNLTITTNEIPNTRSGTKAEVQAEKVDMGILGKIEKGKKSTGEDVPHPPRNNKTDQTSSKSTLLLRDLLVEENQTGQEKLTPDKQEILMRSKR
jgi:hypothetical protein